jgi:hypothetical protein
LDKRQSGEQIQVLVQVSTSDDIKAKPDRSDSLLPASKIEIHLPFERVEKHKEGTIIASSWLVKIASLSGRQKGVVPQMVPLFWVSMTN